jgi:hypothetical protein
MGINLSTVDLSNVEARKPYEPIPDSWQNAVIVNTEMKPTADGTGQYMQVESEVIDGQYKGSKLYDRLNLVNNSETAREIAYKTLKSIYLAVGKVRVNDSAELHGIPFKIKVKYRAGRVEKDAMGNVIKEYSPGNEVGGYDHITSDHATGAGSSLASGVAGAPGGTPAWAAGGTGAATSTGPALSGPTNTAPQPGGTFQPPAGGQPWDKGPVPGVASAPAAPGAAGGGSPPQPTLELTPAGAEGGLTLQDYYDNKWTNDQLVEFGKARWVQPATLTAPGTQTGPGAPPSPLSNTGAPPAATGAANAPTPPWAR